MPDSPAYLLNDADGSALHHVLAHLAANGYSERGVRERLGLRDISELQMRALPIYRKERLAERAVLDIAIDLFLLQGAIRTDELDRLLDRDDQELLVRTGVLKVDETGAGSADASLYPVGNRLFFSDHAWPQLSPKGPATAPFDQVMFVGADSHWLARATVRRPVSNALDLCTGSGIHALLAAAHARSVKAVDINPRAVCCTRFNAQVSGCNNLEAVQGDLYGPVGGERFDLITANPPFVPSPVNDLGFRDGGRSGEDVQRRIVAGLSTHLAQHGIAQIVTEIGERDGEPLVNRVREWLGDAPFDIHVLRLRIHPAAVYAIGHAHGDTPGAFLDSVAAWADNLRDQGFTRVVSVLLCLQWSDLACGPPWNRVDEAYPPERDAGSEIEAGFAAERLSRDPGLRAKLEHGRMVKAGPVILREERMLGSDLPSTCQAKLAGQALSVEYDLDPIERDLLDTMSMPVDVMSLMKIARQINIGEPTLHAALGSLLRKRLIKFAD
jgi:hypothetical protein